MTTRISDQMTIDEFQKRGVKVGECYVRETEDECYMYRIHTVHDWGSVEYTEYAGNDWRDGFIRHGKLTEILYCWGYALVDQASA